MGTLLAILLVYTVYFIFTVTRYDKNGHYKDKNYKYDKSKSKTKITNELKVKDYQKLPSEVKFFVRKYRVDLDKINIRGLLNMIGVILGIDIAISIITVIFIFRDKSEVFVIVVGFISTMVLYLISIKFLGKYFEKKGLCKDE